MLGLKFADCARLSVIDRHQAEGRGLTIVFRSEAFGLIRRGAEGSS
jgi:hypothetical protein